MTSRWKVICQVCGRALYNNQAKKRWDNLIVCPNDWEPKHPLLTPGYHHRRRRGGGGEAARSGLFSPEPADQFVLVCDLYTSMGLSGIGTTGCARTGSYNIPLASTNDIIVTIPPDTLDIWSGLPGVILADPSPGLGDETPITFSGSALTIEFYITVDSYTESSSGAVSPRWDVLQLKQNSSINMSIAIPGQAFGAPGTVDDLKDSSAAWTLSSDRANSRFYVTIVRNGSFSMFWENGIYHGEFVPAASIPTFNTVKIGQIDDLNHQTTFTMEYLRISNVAQYTAGVNFTPPI